ncbi:MAG: hypothetical protein ABI968_12370 [Acidobacteriota bacterium]
MKTGSPARAILTGGIIAGICDITFAFIFYGIYGSTPVRILQTVASGLLGKRSFEGGSATAALGAVFQLVIPTVAAAVYYVLTRIAPALRRHAVVSGILFGVVVYVVMTWVVLPLSAIPFTPSHSLEMVGPAVVAHMFLVGLPIALANRRYLPES